MFITILIIIVLGLLWVISYPNKEPNTIHSKSYEYKKELTSRATCAEKVLNTLLQQSILKNLYEFQKVIFIQKNGKDDHFYIIDFYFPKNKLCIELDGGYHNTKKQKIKDEYRSQELRKIGYKIWRISNDEVFENKNLINNIIKFYNKLNV